MRVLVVTAVAAERDAVARGLPPRSDRAAPAVPGYTLLRRDLPAGDRAAAGAGAGRTPVRGPAPAVDAAGDEDSFADVLAAGVGPAAAAAGTSAALTVAALTGHPYGLVVSAGIGGGFPDVAPVGAVVVATVSVAADLGAEDPGHPGGFRSVTELGFGTGEHRPPAALSSAVARAASAVHAPVLTVSTVTGSAERAALLAERYPGAAAEAMEGFGVAEAAAAHGLPTLEIRGISNPVGPRDRESWRIGAALTALEDAVRALAPDLRARKGTV